MAPYELQHTGETELFPAAPLSFLAVMEEHENGKSYNKGKEEEGDHGIIHETEQQHKVCARGHWRPAEDAKLKELVSQYGPQNWNLIAEELDGRSGKSCRLRWFNQLDTRINRKAFSEEEEERLLAAHRLYGNKWAQIARLLHGRTDNAVKNHWHVIMARKQREQSNADRRRKPPAPSPIFFPSQALLHHKRKEVVSTSNNACSGESSISGTRDECDSTCTDLSLNSLTTSIAPSFLNRQSPSHQQPHSFDMLNGWSDEKVVAAAAARNGPYEKLGGSFFSHGAQASANQPVAYHMSQKRRGREKTRLPPFIDFLGVGAT